MSAFIVKNLETSRSYEVIGHENSTRKSVWDSQKVWLSVGTNVEITSEDGNTERFCRKN